MFTGIVTDIGLVRFNEGGRLSIACGYPPSAVALGASLACDGCCLSITSVEPQGAGSLVTFDVSRETASRTTLGKWEPGRAVNLETAAKLGDDMGGHMVAGHIDGVATIADMEQDGESRRFTIEVPEHLARFIAPKGSVALDGVSLTVNEVDGCRFGVNLIPITLTATTWGRKKPGDLVHVEVDLIARTIARLMEFRA